MSTDIARRETSIPPEIAERVLIHGDLSKLTVNERLAYYKSRCEAAGLSMVARPFEYIQLQGRLVLYATKACTDALAGLHGLSHEIQSIELVAGLIEARIRTTGISGRFVEDIGTVVCQNLRGADFANARMKAVTKGKRRAVLSYCGLGDVIDETELETISEKRECLPSGHPKPLENRSGYVSGEYASPDQAKAYLNALDGYIQKRNSQWLDRWTGEAGELPKGVKDLCNPWQADNHLVKWAVETGRIRVDARTSESGVRNRQIGRYTAVVYFRSKQDRAAITQELRRYIDDLTTRQDQAIRAANPGLFERTLEEADEFEGIDDGIKAEDLSSENEQFPITNGCNPA